MGHKINHCDSNGTYEDERARCRGRDVSASASVSHSGSSVDKSRYHSSTGGQNSFPCLSDIAVAGWPLRSSRGLLAATVTLLSGGFELAVALSVNLDLSACKHILRCHVADRTVQPRRGINSPGTLKG